MFERITDFVKQGLFRRKMKRVSEGLSECYGGLNKFFNSKAMEDFAKEMGPVLVFGANKLEKWYKEHEEELTELLQSQIKAGEKMIRGE